MKFKEKIKSANWREILIYYTLAFGLTYIFTKLPNLIKNIWSYIFGLNVSFSWNHGIGLLIGVLICYRFFKENNKTTFLGTKPFKSLILTSCFLIFYAIFVLSNKFGINEHLWALIFCSSMLIYNIFEETAWRGYLNDKLGNIPTWLKGIITGFYGVSGIF